jgi:hypothetical protein
MSLDDRRQRPRVTVSLPLTMYGDGEDGPLLMRAHTVDMSTVGALLHGSTHIEIGRRVRIEVPRGAARNPLWLSAQVVRIAKPEAGRHLHGVAVRFVDLSALDEAVLATIIAEAQH